MHTYTHPHTYRDIPKTEAVFAWEAKPKMNLVQCVYWCVYVCVRVCEGFFLLEALFVCVWLPVCARKLARKFVCVPFFCG